MKRMPLRQRGFSLLELMVAVAVFTVLCGAVFALLNAAQQRYKTESQVLESFQSARLALDEIARDIHSAGYPPPNAFTAAAAAANPQRVALPFAWSPNYPATPCTVGVNCNVSNAFDLIVEADIDPQNNNGIEWVRYQLQGTTLFRGVATKAVGVDPVVATGAVMVPYVDNVMNNAPAAQMTLIRTYYAGMFPGNTPVPVFSYVGFDSGKPNTTQYLRDVNITLIVMAPERDPQTLQPRVVTLTGRARRVNPSQ